MRLAPLFAFALFATLLPAQQTQTPPPGFSIAPPPQYDALTLIPQGLTALNSAASWHTDFTFDRSLLALAGGFAGVDDETRRTIARLNGIGVHLYRFPEFGGYDPASVDAIRAQYSSLGWKHIVTANRLPDRQGPYPDIPGQFIPAGSGRTDVWLETHGADFAGAAILLAGDRSVNLITVSGDIRTLDLLHLRGHFGIPKFPEDALSR